MPVAQPTKTKEPIDVIAQQEAEQTVPVAPNFIRETLDEATKSVQAPDPTMDEVMAQGASSEFWKYLREYIVQKQGRLHNLLSDSVRSKDPDLNNIGLRYLIHDQVTAALQDIIDRVEVFEKARQAKLREEAAKREEQQQKP